jgi:cobalt-zinc-cadmium efflux system membrane fusion protein
VIAGACLASAIGCNGGENGATAAAKPAAANPLRVQVPIGLRDQIAVGKPLWEDVTTQEKVAARVETDVSRVARIGSPVDGRITRMLVYEGQKVQQGQLMAMLHSNALSDTQFSFLKAFFAGAPC